MNKKSTAFEDLGLGIQDGALSMLEGMARGQKPDPRSAGRVIQGLLKVIQDLDNRVKALEEERSK